MKKLFLTVLLSLFVMGVYAQKKVLRNAEKALRKENYEEAITLAKQAAENPETQDEPDVYITIAQAYLKQFEGTEKQDMSLAQTSVDWYKKAIEKGDEKLQEDLMEAPVFLPNDPTKPIGGGEDLGLLNNYMLTIGDAAWNAQEYKKAYQAFSISAQIEPRVDINFFAGVAAQSAEMADEAVKYYKLVADSDEEYEYKPEAYLELIRVYRMDENYDEAIAYIKKAKEAFPDDEQFNSMEVDVLIDADRLDEAVKELEGNIAAGKADKTQYYYLAYLQWSGGNSDEAVEAGKKALELDPDYYEANYVVGGALYDKAAAKLTEANNEVDDMEKYQTMKDEAIEMFKKAQPYFEKCFAQKQDDTYIIKPLSTIYDQLDQDAKRDQMLDLLDKLEGTGE